ncbi:MAG: hypothetical protein AAB384_00575 [Patescibacteria group bacterium]
MYKPPRQRSSLLHVVSDTPDATGLLYDTTAADRATTVVGEEGETATPRFLWLAPDPLRTLPRMRVHVLCLTVQEALSFLDTWFPTSAPVVSEQDEQRVKRSLGARWYRELRAYGYLRVRVNPHGIKMVRLDETRLAVTYPYIVDSISPQTRLRMVHRTDSPWRPVRGFWAELLRRAYDDAHDGSSGTRGEWEVERYRRRIARKQIDMQRREAKLLIGLIPSYHLCITPAHALVLTQFLAMKVQQEDLNKRSALQLELVVQRLSRPLVAALLRYHAISKVEKVKEEGDWIEFELEFFDRCHIEIVAPQTPERLRQLRNVVEQLQLPWLYHNARFRLAQSLRHYKNNM